METLRHGDIETWRHGDRDMETWRHGNMETWKHKDIETWKHGHEVQAIFLKHFPLAHSANGSLSFVRLLA
jgi:hypothetical protein